MLKESFLEYLRLERNYSEKTVISYEADLNQFEAYLKGVDENLDFIAADADLLRGWVMQLMERKYTETSVNRKLSSLRTFYRYLLRKGAVKADPMQKVVGPKKKKPLPVFVKDADMNRLLDETDFGNSFEGVRDRLILEMFYVTGIRLSELIGLRDADVDLSAGTIKVTGKRNKQRLIPFGEELKEDLLAYLDARNAYYSGLCNSFFIRKEGKPLYSHLIYVLVKKYLSKVVISSLPNRDEHLPVHKYQNI